MRTVQLYINNLRVDLFDDEQIQVTSSTQNISDISKVFTDFSQTFTVPASPNNNAIFDHYYNNDVNGTFLAKERQTARIEINHTPFRRGKIQLEGAEIVQGEARSYMVTFYGDVVTLKDLFGDDKLKDLDYTSISHERTGANVQTSITSGSSLDVRYPLISSSRVWTYGDAASTDISASANAIDYTELFPALRVSKVFDLIESKYGVTFNGNFLNNKRFTNLYTWWKNREESDFTTEAYDLDFDFSGTANVLYPTYSILDTANQIDLEYIDPSTYPTPADFGSWYGVPARHQISFFIFNTSTSSPYYLDVYRNGVLSHTVEGAGDQLLDFNDVCNVENVFGLNDTYTFKLRASGSFTFDFTIKYRYVYYYFDNVSSAYTVGEEQYQVTTSSNSISDFVDFSSSAPDIRVDEYFSGVLRMFNLTCYPLDTELNYQIEPLEDWYASGDEIDITQYVDVDSIKVDRPKLYREIGFDWKDSKSFMNEAYKEINNREYGTLREYFGYDGGDFTINLPFETLLFNKFTGEQLQVAYSLEKAPDYKPYIPAPVMLYLNEQETGVSFYLDNGTTTDEITSYYPFGQEVFYNNEDHSINFNEEISSLSLEAVYNSLYMEYYYPYLKNLFSDKTRIVTVKSMLPLRLLNYISLDDAIIIRDKKYRINDMRSNLTTGEVELVLISDWIAQRRRFVIPPIFTSGSGSITVPIKPIKPNLGGYTTVSGTGTFTTPSETLPYTFNSEGEITFTYTANATGSDRTDSFEIKYYDPEGTLRETVPVVISQKGTTGFLLISTGNYLITDTLDRIEI